MGCGHPRDRRAHLRLLISISRSCILLVILNAGKGRVWEKRANLPEGYKAEFGSHQMAISNQRALMSGFPRNPCNIQLEKQKLLSIGS